MFFLELLPSQRHLVELLFVQNLSILDLFFLVYCALRIPSDRPPLNKDCAKVGTAGLPLWIRTRRTPSLQQPQRHPRRRWTTDLPGVVPFVYRIWPLERQHCLHSRPSRVAARRPASPAGFCLQASPCSFCRRFSFRPVPSDRADSACSCGHSPAGLDSYCASVCAVPHLFPREEKAFVGFCPGLCPCPCPCTCPCPYLYLGVGSGHSS